VPLKTVVGDVEVTRVAFGARGNESLHPLDAALNLPPEVYSLGVRRRAAIEASRNSFDETVATIGETTGTTLPKRQAEQLVRRAAADFDDFYETRRAAATSAADEQTTGEILVITSDAKGIAMRKEDLREATRKAADTHEPKLATRVSPGEKRHRKRMAMVAAVYTIEPFIRRPEDIVKDLRPAQELAIKRPRPERKRVWASVEKGPEAILDEAFAEALSRDPKREKRWAVLVDGNEVQLGDVLALVEEHELKVSVIVDIIHVLEYVWKAAWAFHEKGCKEAEAWVTERFLEILRGRSSEVAGGIRRSATLRGLSAEERAPVDDCADYLIKYREFLRYDEYLAAGLPIATGVIEGACRHLVQDRMGRTGARWSLEGAEAVLRLRALRSSMDFEEYWSFHEDCELTRNHRSRYAQGVLPEMVMPPRKPGRVRHLEAVR
jgi:hypothetical protein